MSLKYKSNGTFTDLNEIVVTPNLTTKTITANGTYNAISDNVEGYSSVTVAVLPPPDYISEGLAFALKPLLSVENITLDQTRRFSITSGMTIEAEMMIGSEQGICRIFELKQGSSKVCNFCMRNSTEVEAQVFGGDSGSWATTYNQPFLVPPRDKKFHFSMLVDNTSLVAYVKINDTLVATWDVSGISGFSAYSESQFTAFSARRAYDVTVRDATYCTLENVHVYSRPLTAQEQTHNFDIAKVEYELEV